jgi:hypothetical protein
MTRPPDHEPTAWGTTRRLQALASRGWSPQAIQAATGIPAGKITAAIGDHHAAGPGLDHQVAAAYQLRWNRPPPRATPRERALADAARAEAERHGWAPPMAWDDDQIDLPLGRPAVGWKRVRLTGRAADMAEDVAFLRDTGYRQAPAEVLALRLGVQKKTLQRALIRHASKTRETARQRQADKELEAG